MTVWLIPTAGDFCFAVWTRWLWHKDKTVNCGTDVIYDIFATKENCGRGNVRLNQRRTNLRIAAANSEIARHVAQCSNCSLDAKKWVLLDLKKPHTHTGYVNTRYKAWSHLVHSHPNPFIVLDGMKKNHFGYAQYTFS